MIDLHTIAIISLGLSFVCTLIVILDIILRNQQQMMIMNFVYPITTLYAGPLGLLFYYVIGIKSTKKEMMQAMKNKEEPKSKKKPFPQSVAVGALHCGSGCTLGDMIAEMMMLFLPFVLLGSRLYAAWVVDYIFAFALGILFQYYSIKPMKKLTPKDGLKAALKADTLSLTFWQIGMYGWMAIATFLIFGHELKPNNPVFWFMMQIGMLCGFITSYPVNWWLLKKGIKEIM